MIIQTLTYTNPNKSYSDPVTAGLELQSLCTDRAPIDWISSQKETGFVANRSWDEDTHTLTIERAWDEEAFAEYESKGTSEQNKADINAAGWTLTVS